MQDTYEFIEEIFDHYGVVTKEFLSQYTDSLDDEEIKLAVKSLLK